MSMQMGQEEVYGLKSPGGFVFGVTGWHWGEPRPTTITFFLDNTAKVCDQHGRPIKGGLYNNIKVEFASRPPTQDDPPGSRKHLATHLQVIQYLRDDLKLEWDKLVCAGWPQIPYEELKKLPVLPPTPLEELRKIPSAQLRKDAIRAKQEEEASIRQAMEEEVGEE